MKTSRVLLLVAAATAVSGCGKSVHRPEGMDSTGPITSKFHATLDQLYSQGYVSACDQALKTKAYELADDLDRRQKEIDAAPVAPANSKTFKAVHLGNLDVREVRPVAEQPKDEWKNVTHSWKSALKDYDKIRGSSNLDDWVGLRSDFGAMLSDDLTRTYNGSYWATGHADNALLLGIVAELERCRKDASCVAPTLNEAQTRWLMRQPAYRDSLLALQMKSLTHEQAARMLNRLESDVSRDQKSIFGMRSNPTVRRLDESTIEVPLIAGPFESIEESIADYIESMWKSPDLQLKVRWANAGETNVFQFLFDDGATGRSFVRFTKKQVHIFSGVRSSALAHEIGHVAGFPDRYYTIWDESTCSYSVEFNSADIMSEETHARALPDEIATLKKIYPLQAPKQ